MANQAHVRATKGTSAQAVRPVTNPSTPSTKRSFADMAERAWIVSVVGYSLLRFVIAWGAFAEHGANIWVFGLIDVGTAWPYAKAVALVCRRAANAEWSQLPVPVFAAITTFFAPYAYLWFAAGEMPAGVRLSLILCVSVLLVAATTGVLMKTRRLRRDDVIDVTALPAAEGSAEQTRLDDNDAKPASTAATVAAATGATEMLIDLTQPELKVWRLPLQPESV